MLRYLLYDAHQSDDATHVHVVFSRGALDVGFGSHDPQVHEVWHQTTARSNLTIIINMTHY